MAGLKYAMDLVGFYGGPARPPLLPLNSTAKAEIDEMLMSVTRGTAEEAAVTASTSAVKA
jgi:dihydrodipicolinate synthase/N-acetylneuraminate lyase